MTWKNQILTVTLFALIVGVVVFMFPATPTQAQDGAVRYRSVRIDNALTVGGNSTMAGTLTVVGAMDIGTTTADVATITDLTATTITATTIISQAVGFDTTGNGTNTAPAYTFASDTNTGIYRVGADDIGLTAGGVKVFDCIATGCTNTGTLASTGVAALNAGITVDTTAFTVADVSGNVATAGTLNVTGVTTLGAATITTATVTSLSLGGQTQSGAVRYGTAATYTSGSIITHGFTVTPTMCIASPEREITATVTITTTGFSWDTASRATPIFWVCGK